MARYDVTDAGPAASNNSQYRMPDLSSSPFSGPSSNSGIGLGGFSPTVVSQGQSTLGNLVGARAPSAPGVSYSTSFGGAGGAGSPDIRKNQHVNLKAKGGKVVKKAKGGAIKKAKGGKVSSASKRADGCATKGKTKGRFV